MGAEEYHTSYVIQANTGRYTLRWYTVGFLYRNNEVSRARVVCASLFVALGTGSLAAASPRNVFRAFRGRGSGSRRRELAMDALRQQHERLSREAAVLRTREPPTAAELLDELTMNAQPVLQLRLQAQQQAEVDAMEDAVRTAAARRRQQEERRAMLLCELRDGVNAVAECIRARHEREHAALQSELERLLPRALDEWRGSDAQMQATLDDELRPAQRRLLACLESMKLKGV